MTNIENFIHFFTSNTNSFSREDLQYLFNAKQIVEKKYQSSSFNPEQRIDYLIDFISNYESEDFSKYTHFLLLIGYSSNYPLIISELETLFDFLEKILPASAKIKLGNWKNEDLDKEVSLMLLGSY